MRYIKTILPMVCIAFVALFFAGCTLSAPQIQLNGYVISWASVDRANSYEVNVDGISFTTNDTEVNLIQYLQKGNITSVRVKALTGSYFYSASNFSNSVSLSKGTNKLSTPLNLAVDVEGNRYNFTWDAVENAEHYCLRLIDNVGVEQYLYADTNSFDATGKISSSGEISLSVFAYADNSMTYAPSEYSESVVFCNSVLLATPTNTKLTATNQGYLYTWDAVKDAASYNVSILNGETLSTETNSVFINKTQLNGAVLFVSVQAVSANPLMSQNSAYSNMDSYYSSANKNDYLGKYYTFGSTKFDLIADSKSELDAIIHFTLYYRINNLEYYVNYNGFNVNDTIDALDSYNEIKYINYIAYPNVNSAGRYKLIVTKYLHPNYPDKVATGDIVVTQNEYVQPTSFTKNPRSIVSAKFKIDERTETMMVYSSDQLYYAIQKGCKPVFPNEDCPAKDAYDQAKLILCQIIDDSMSDYQKVLAIFDWLTYTVKYDYNGLELVDTPGIGDTAEINRYRCFYIEGVLFDGGQAVCDGIGKTFALLCGIEGIDCYKVSGWGNGGGHAWNKVKLDLNNDGVGEWYAVDSTWADLVDTSVNKYEEILSHSFFLVTDAEMIATTHIEEDPKTDVANTVFDYYEATKYDGVNSLNIDTRLELENLCRYMLETNTRSMEFKTILNYGVVSTASTYLLGDNYFIEYNYSGTYILYRVN